jgi:hypothetical protein
MYVVRYDTHVLVPVCLCITNRPMSIWHDVGEDYWSIKKNCQIFIWNYGADVGEDYCSIKKLQNQVCLCITNRPMSIWHDVGEDYWSIKTNCQIFLWNYGADVGEDYCSIKKLQNQVCLCITDRPMSIWHDVGEDYWSIKNNCQNFYEITAPMWERTIAR